MAMHTDERTARKTLKEIWGDHYPYHYDFCAMIDARGVLYGRFRYTGKQMVALYKMQTKRDDYESLQWDIDDFNYDDPNEDK